MDFVIGKVRLSFGRGQSRPEHSQAPSLRAAADEQRAILTLVVNQGKHAEATGSSSSPARVARSTAPVVRTRSSTVSVPNGPAEFKQRASAATFLRKTRRATSGSRPPRVATAWTVSRTCGRVISTRARKTRRTARGAGSMSSGKSASTLGCGTR